MSKQPKYCISIAGLDPSGGAGILADIKTFEAHDVIGFGVCTAITYQHESEFEGVDWLSEKQIIQQIDVLLKKYPVRFFKIGLIENLNVLKAVVDHIRQKVIDAFIVWDPIMKASAGFTFHNESQPDITNYKIDLITPNMEEIDSIGKPEILAKTAAVLLKGGHAKHNANDMLFHKENIVEFPSEKIAGAAKHGSGCVLSASILAHMSTGKTLIEACDEGKKYITDFLTSTTTLLGKHQQTAII